jgi:hypothetical protein
MAADEFGHFEGGHQAIRQSAVRRRRLDRRVHIARSMFRIPIQVLCHRNPPRSCGAERVFGADFFVTSRASECREE